MTAIDTTAGEAYEKHMVPGMFARWTERAVGLAALRPGERLVDVACGTGIGARVAAQALGRSGKATALDLDAGVVEIARCLPQGDGATIEYHCANALEMPFPDEAFDVALCLQGLQFFPDRVKGFTEIRRVLKPSGRLIATIWGPLEANKGHAAVVHAIERQQVDASAAKRACSFADPTEIRDAAARGGFGNIEVRTEDGASEFASFDSFMQGMTVGSPSTRRAVQLIPESGKARFVEDVREALAPWIVGGKLAYPMRTHIVIARA
jgi:SAM-dependent methyltransferase